MFLRLVLMVALFGCNSMSGHEKQKSVGEKAGQPSTAPKPTSAVKKEASVSPKPSSVKSNPIETRYAIKHPKISNGDPVKIQIRPLGEYKINEEYPASLNFTPQSSKEPKSAEEKTKTAALLSFEVPKITKSQGAAPSEVKAVIDFSVCNKELCELIEKELSWTVKPDA